jgi:hypothetical protein
MRDFNNDGNIQIGGNLNIHDESQNEHKLLIHCSSGVLLEERPFRQENLRIERKRKLKRLSPFYGTAVILFLIAATWAQIKGKPDLVAYVLGLGSLAIAYLSLNATVEPNSFELEEQEAIRQINNILKARRVE